MPAPESRLPATVPGVLPQRAERRKSACLPAQSYRHFSCFVEKRVATSVAVTVDFLQPVIGADMAAVDRTLRAALDSDVVLIRQVAEYIVGGGGKRLRPALLLLTAGATGYRGTEHHTLAAVIEMIHTATLLHDDVVDESTLRRGHATANAEFGNAASVLVGDFLYSRAFQMMVGLQRMRVLEILAETTNAIAEGEVLQLMNAGDADFDEAAYLNVIQRKTARLFEAAARLGAVLGDAAARGRGRARALRHASRHRLPARRRRARLLGQRRDHRQEPGRRPRRRQDDAAPHPRLGHGRRSGCGGDSPRDCAAAGLTDFAPVVAALERTGALAYTRTRAPGRSPLRGGMPGRITGFCAPAKSARIDVLRGSADVLPYPCARRRGRRSRRGMQFTCKQFGV